jgi:hypothetical protein
VIYEDPALCRRAVELGFRMLGPDDELLVDELPRYLRQRGIPVPAPSEDYTRAALPTLPLLKTMMAEVGGCR